MAERTYNPNSPACGQWEALLADALDGLLKPADEAAFAAHRSVCPACSALFEEARQGREWLEFLSPEPEVPAGLLDKILAKTGPGQAPNYNLATAGNVLPVTLVSRPAWQRPGLMGHIRRFAEPRLMMTAAMAFFSIALTINITGIRLSDVRLSSLQLSNLRPSMMRSIMERRLTAASTPIIRYYDHLELLHEVRSRVQDLRRTTQSEDEENRQRQQDSAPGESKQAPVRQNGGSPADAPQQSAKPDTKPTIDNPDFLEASLRVQDQSSIPAAKILRQTPEPAHSNSSETEVRERNTKWTA
jgi:hypothetical protein